MLKQILSFSILTQVAFSVEPETNFYKTYTGTIGKYPFTMHMCKSGSWYGGVYYYDSMQEPIAFSSSNENNTKKDITVVMRAGEGDNEEKFAINFNGNNISGTWTCKNKNLPCVARESSAAIAFDYKQHEDSIKFYVPNTTVLVGTGTYSVRAFWPIRSEYSFLQKIISQGFRPTDQLTNIDAIIRKEKNIIFADFRKETAIDLKEIEKELSTNETLAGWITSGSHNGEKAYSKEFNLIFQSQKFCSFEIICYECHGGAHGSLGSYALAIDLKNKKILSLEDIITKKGQQILPQFQIKFLRKKLNICNDRSLDDYDEDNIKAHNNFYITEKGIGFIYNPYEIACFAMGIITIFVPFTALREYLNPDFKKLLDS